VKSPAAHNFIPSAGSVAARQRAGNPRLAYEQPALTGWPRPILDNGSPRRTMVLRQPKPAYISLTARRAQPAGPPPTQPTHTNTKERKMRQIDDPHLTNHSPYQAIAPATLSALFDAEDGI
jgi:hypothetical protein